MYKNSGSFLPQIINAVSENDQRMYLKKKLLKNAKKKYKLNKLIKNANKPYNVF